MQGNNTLNAYLSLTADSVFTSLQDTLTLSQTISQGKRDLTLQGQGDWNISGQFTGDKKATLTLTSDGTTTISGDINVGGGVVIDNSGTVVISM
ncbi:MAG: hypothetical protein J6386_05710 [Candidatus Synoicihabitans palmerolidicus]|nr:hypothetical protein [Candidatus Synoicihabitans palmerolidicus]